MKIRGTGCGATVEQCEPGSTEMRPGEGLERTQWLTEHGYLLVTGVLAGGVRYNSTVASRFPDPSIQVPASDCLATD